MTTLRRVADRPSWLLSRANARAQALLHEAFAANGVRGYHFRLLAALDEHGSGSQADIGRWAGLDRSDVVATLNELVRDGLAARAPDRSDRRRNVVSITRKGTAALQRLQSVVDDVQEAVLAPLSAGEREQLVRVLKKLS